MQESVKLLLRKADKVNRQMLTWAAGIVTSKEYGIRGTEGTGVKCRWSQ